MIKHITFIGSGNVATHLAKAFHQSEFKIDMVYSRTKSHAKSLAQELDADWTNRIKKIPGTSELYVICIPDHAIDSISKSLSKQINKDAIIVHTSGSTSSDVFNNKFDHFGVFYPLQSFSKQRMVDLSVIPFFVTGSSHEISSRLVDLAIVLSDNVQLISDDQRLTLHVSAVFANNFSNFLFQISDELLQENQLNFDLLKPLIRETANKVMTEKPKDMQTGPAIRNDQLTLQKHLAYLSKFPKYRELYAQLSKMLGE